MDKYRLEPTALNDATVIGDASNVTVPDWMKRLDERITVIGDASNVTVPDWMKRLDEKITVARANLTELRKGTQELSHAFAETDRQFHSSKRMFQAFDKQAAERIQHLDEMIYLNRLINHLDTTSRQMILVPVHVTREKVKAMADTKESCV